MPASLHDEVINELFDRPVTARQLARRRHFDAQPVRLSDILCVGREPMTDCAASGDCLEVLSWNVQFHTSVVQPFSDRPDHVADQIKQYDCDVVLLQEAYILRVRQRLVHSLKGSGPYREKKRRGGLLVFSKWPVVDHAKYRYENNPGLRSRGVVYIAIEKHGRRHHIFNTHLWWDKTVSNLPDEATEADERRAWREDQATRVRQVRELDDFIRSRNIPDGEPVVIAGDFNFGGPHSPRQEKNGDGMPGYHGLVEQVLRARDIQRYYEEVERKKDRIIDHILVRNAPCDGCTSNVTEMRPITDAHLSDHPPYRGHFEFG